MNAERTGSPRGPAGTPSGRAVVLVERGAAAARSLSRRLSDFGYPVRIVPALAGLPAAVAELRPAAVIIDQETVAAAGEALSALRALAGFECPAIAISDRDDLESRLYTVRAGFDAHLVKDEAPARLAETLDWLLHRRRAEPYRVVIIDDDRFTAGVMAISLQRAGLEATVVSEITRVLEVLRTARPEVLLIDIHMPACNGIDLAAAIRQVPDFLHIPLIFVTTEKSPEHRMLAVQSGGNDFLTKPVPPDLLIATVRARAEWSRQLDTTLHRLSESEERFRAVAETASDAIVATDEVGRIIYSNTVAQGMFGRDGRELLDHSALALVAPAHRRPLVRALRRCDDAAGRRTLELEGLDGRNRAFPVEVSVSSWQAGGRRHFTGIIRDISERRRAEERLAEARRRADAANEAKSAHVSRMVHELRTPLNAVLGYTQMLQRTGTLSDRQVTWTGHVLSAGEHMLNLTNDALDLAQIEAGKIYLSFDRLDAAVIASDCLILTEPEAIRHGVALAPFAGAPPPLRADSLRVKQVLLNLLSNAVKYGGRGAVVSLDAEPVAGGALLRFTVADTGSGIPADQLSGLFQPFHRLPGNRRGIEGSGMGLSISRLLVEAMGGEIGVASEPGAGSRFWFTVPTAPEVTPAD